MRLQRVAFALALLVGSGGAFAHAHLNSSTPAAGAQLTVAPQTLTLEFSEAAQLTAPPASRSTVLRLVQRRLR